MDNKVVIAIISANASEPEVIRLCAGVLKDMKDNKAACALKYHLLKNPSLPECGFLEKFHSICYENENENTKSWKNEKGELHCMMKDADGKILPAVIIGDIQSWYQDGKRFSPGVDENGFSLPNVVSGTLKMWSNESGNLHRNEFAEDGMLLPAKVMTDGTEEWWFEGKQYTKEEILKKFPLKNQEKSIDLKGRKMKKMTISADRKSIDVEYDDAATTYDMVMNNVKRVDFGEEKLDVNFKDDDKMEIKIDGLKLRSFAIVDDVATITVEHV